MIMKMHTFLVLIEHEDFVSCFNISHLCQFEPRREKTGLRDFRPGPT